MESIQICIIRTANLKVDFKGGKCALYTCKYSILTMHLNVQYYVDPDKPWDNLLTSGTKWFSRSCVECSAAIVRKDSTACVLTKEIIICCTRCSTTQACSTGFQISFEGRVSQGPKLRTAVSYVTKNWELATRISRLFSLFCYHVSMDTRYISRIIEWPWKGVQVICPKNKSRMKSVQVQTKQKFNCLTLSLTTVSSTVAKLSSGGLNEQKHDNCQTYLH